MDDEDEQHLARALAVYRLGEDDDGGEAARFARLWGPLVTTAAASALRRSARRLAYLATVCAVAARRLTIQ